MKTIGLLGGSFDPIHVGHIHMAVEAYEHGGLDEVWLIPNGNTPHKDSDKMTEAKHRLAMCELVAKEYPFIKVCDIEINSEEPCYTYMTVTKLVQQYMGKCSFCFIMGSDSLEYFDEWKNPEIIAGACRILVLKRAGSSSKSIKAKMEEISSKFFARITFINSPRVDVSSTEIRANLVSKDVLPSIYDYICEHHLYGN